MRSKSILVVVMLFSTGYASATWTTINKPGATIENCIDNGTAKFLAKPDKPKRQISG